MAAPNYWEWDTSGFGQRLYGSLGTNTVGLYNYWQIIHAQPKVEPVTMRAWTRLRLAETRTRSRPTSDPLPPSMTSRPLTVRRELQRAGPTGFARLGGRRPL